ncbi:hydantoinase/oxoprolinase family protein [Acidianus sp. HS-5]|uniref:hydantoinase/oxoprolinase family protein n=1 Tax=Acidianus sp. HS-5 TaxID=2886040 RepID=UPI001F3760AF|nr:hydantoinase/oxoprolinase family protein [Acidianus sp. HS-5]BDC18485.1 5-oxoprolinase [Acidianus sp. HS-5]
MIVAVDVGGTFTDIVGIEGDKITVYKGLTTPKSPEIGVYEGLKKGNFHPEEIIHATTIATNAILGQVNLELPEVALLTTKEFKDVIEIGRQNRPELYNPFFDKPLPLVPRDKRFEVDERTDAEGGIIKMVNEEEVERLIKSIKANAIAISFLHSYINPENEKVTANIARKYFQYVSVSHEIAPEPREYERTSTTVLNATLMPIVSRYLEALESMLKEFGSPSIYIMASSGGLIDKEEASRRPVQIIESGPAAGVVGVVYFSEILGIKNAISFDMGGTTAKAGTVVDHKVEITTEYEVGGKAHHGRIIKGSGYPVRFPFVDLSEVSAGGGTIIWKDNAGGLRVGPISAGADPGPISYARGGKDPTLTDANVALGRVESLLSGEMKLDKEGAIKGLSKLGDYVEVANEAIKLANLEMGRAIRLVTVERGLDPGDFTLFAYGGAGPQYAIDLAEEMGISTVIIPPYPGLFSALGMLFADKKYEARKSYPKDLEKDFEELESRVKGKYYLRYADVRYEGQGWEITIPVKDVKKIKEDFEAVHEKIYGFTLDKDIEIVTIRVFGIIPSNKVSLPKPKTEGKPSVKYRKVYFDDWIETPIYRREELQVNYEIEGPAIIEEYSSTTVIKSGWKAVVDNEGFIRCEK